jgi:hypothetical protein
MIKPVYNTLFILIFLLFGCSSTYTQNDKKVVHGYALSSPDATFTLPDILMEISGAAYIGSNSLACIQDENGYIFIYNILKGEISDQYSFSIDGDYEGITLVGQTLYVLRSDGTLFEIPDYKAKTPALSSYITGIPAANNEGLCYDKENNRLLIACKSSVGKGKELKDHRAIYAFDLKTKTLGKEPVFNFDVHVLKNFALKHNVPMEVRSKKDGKITEPILRFRPSAICIHPISKKLFLLSAVDHMLFIFDMKGNIEHMEALNPEVFNKAEGITFFENGDMLITNEGQNKKPTILRFNYKR